MTREEAIAEIKYYMEHDSYADAPSNEACQMAINALRPVSREQVEKIKKEPVEREYDELYAPTYKCPECGFWNTGRGNFCRNCGCPHTDEAVKMVTERRNKLHD